MKVTTLNFIHRGNEKIDFSYDVNVTKDGKFTTTLSKEVVSIIESYGVTLNQNRVGNHGYFSSDTLEGLIDNIRNTVEEAVSCEIVGTEDVIMYQILICASYCKNGADETDTNLYPNGQGLYNSYQWVEGNVKNDALSQKPTSFSVFARPMTIK